MLINNIKVKENRIIAVIDKNDKKNLIDLDEDNTVLEELNLTSLNKNMSEEKKQERLEELFKMVNLSFSILDRKINTLSTSERLKLYFSKKLLDNTKLIVIEDFFKSLDVKNKNKIFKILLKLKKYHDKTIFIYTNDLDYIYEVIDDVIIIDGEETFYNNKYDIFSDINSCKPQIYCFIEKLKKKYPNIHYKDSINELIKEIYRELR